MKHTESENMKNTTLDNLFKRLLVLKDKGVEIRFNTFQEKGIIMNNVAGVIPGTEHKPKYPKIININYWESIQHWGIEITKIEDLIERCEIWEDGNFFKLQKTLEKESKK